jgi:hypothetical protein
LTAENRQHEALAGILDRLRALAADIARDVAVDLGADVTPEFAEPVVQRFLSAVSGGRARVGDADLVRLRAEGAASARQGQQLATPIDAYLSTAWVAWDHALRLEPGADPVVLGTLGAALLRAGDDIAAALADGYTAAERALAATAGAARQAILDELLAPWVTDPTATARQMRRAALLGFDAALGYHVLVIRPDVESEATGDLVHELERRLARDPVRRPHLVAARGTDVVAIAAPAARDGVAFGEHLQGLGPDVTWWATVAGPVPLDRLASAYADAVDALRIVPTLAEPGRVVPIGQIALERAMVADPALAATGALRWLGPLETAGRGGPELVRTLEAWLDTGGSVVASARSLGVAPRTVSYRLARMAGLLGVRELDAGVRARLSAALLVRRLLEPSLDSGPGVGQLASGR